MLANEDSIRPDAVLSVAEGAEIQPFEDGGVLLNADTGQLYSCNHVTMAYLQRMDGRKSIEALAVEVADHRGIHGPGTGWVVLADPEGNEFCILRSLEEIAANPGTG